MPNGPPSGILLVSTASPGIPDIVKNMRRKVRGRFGIEEKKIRPVLGRFDFAIPFECESNEEFHKLIQEFNDIEGVGRTETLLYVDI
jgi:hypothetical protein